MLIAAIMIFFQSEINTGDYKIICSQVNIVSEYRESGYIFDTCWQDIIGY